MSGEDKAFVVMQIGTKDSPERKRADETFDFIVKPALAQFHIKAYRADLDPSPGGITAKMLTELLECRLVIADLTGRNPNVFYELGIAHSFARPLISIVDTVDTLPFDTKDQRVIELGAYSDSGLTYAQGETAKKALVASLEVVLADGYDPPSPVRDVAGSQSLDKLAPENPFASELSAMRETIDEIRSLITPRRVVPSSIRADIELLRRGYERLVIAGLLRPEDLPTLIDGDSSPGHDEWAGKLRDMRPLGAPSAQPHQDDPWGTPVPSPAQDPWAASPGEEPPF